MIFRLQAVLSVASMEGGDSPRNTLFLGETIFQKTVYSELLKRFENV